MKSKEDILDGYESTRVQLGYEREDRVDMWERGCIEQAMDEYTKQEVLGVIGFMMDNRRLIPLWYRAYTNLSESVYTLFQKSKTNSEPNPDDDSSTKAGE